MTRYNDDLAAWATEQAAAIRAGNWSAVDAENIAEEIDALGRHDARAVRAQLTRLLIHLLKWQFQPGLRCTSWRTTIISARDELTDLLDESPSLRARTDEFMGKAWQKAQRGAVAETGLAPAVFPAACPWSFEQVINDAFWPGE